MAFERITQSVRKLTRRDSSETSLAGDAPKQAGSRFRTRWLLWPVAVVLVALIGLGWYWSLMPEPFNIAQRTEARLAEKGREPVVGAATTVSLITVTEYLLEKPGGYLSNDITPPSLWLDNMPNWEYGATIQVRDMSKAMREAFSRSQSQSLEDEDLAVAESRFNFNNTSWMFPSTEGQYRDGIKHLHSYLNRLTHPQDNQARFFARADNLRYWLSTVETRLGNLSQRLSASVGQQRINTDLAGERAANRSKIQGDEAYVKTPWLEIDDVYFEARGSAWALIHFLRGIEQDFADVLDNKNALVSLRQIIRELEATQHNLYSPLVLNGSGFGIFANHSLVMASYISRAHAALIDMRELLEQG